MSSTPNSSSPTGHYHPFHYHWDDDSTVSNPSTVAPPSKRRKVSKVLFEPVWILEEDSDRGSVRTHSVETQWKRYPRFSEANLQEDFGLIVTWRKLVTTRKLRSRNIDIYERQWSCMEDGYNFELHPEFHRDDCYIITEDDAYSLPCLLTGAEQLGELYNQYSEHPDYHFPEPDSIVSDTQSEDESAED